LPDLQEFKIMPCHTRSTSTQGRQIGLSGLLLLLTAAPGGCGKPAAPPAAPTASPAAPATAANPAPESSTTASETSAATPGSVRVDAQGRKWIGDIPYDVFFEEPLAIAADRTAVSVAPGTMAAATPTAPAATATPAPAAGNSGAASGGGAADWKSLISMEQINNEAKRVRNHLTASLQSQGTYNGNYLELQTDGSVVAALAMIAAEHPEDASWKQNARYLREFGFQLRESSKALGRESFTASQTAAENIQAVLNGNLPAEAGDPAASKPYSEAASRSGVMKRIEKASEWMRANINSQSVFDAEVEQIRQEAAVLSALAKMVGDKSYDSADEEEYAGYARDLLSGARDVGAAAQEKDFAKFNDSMNKIQKACGECHANYGNG
jgi:cytochrome c556